MRLLRNISFAFLLIHFFSNRVNCQEITGLVTRSFDGKPLNGVVVLIPGTTRGTITDNFGNYRIEVDTSHTVLLFNFIGYFQKSLEIDGQTIINASLEEKPTLLQTLRITENPRTTFNNGDIVRIMNIEQSGWFDTLRYSITSLSKEDMFSDDSIYVSKIIAQIPVVDSLSKFYIVDFFPTENIMKSLCKYLIKKIQYPKLAKEYGIMGLVSTTFTIDIEGNIKDLKILKNIDVLGDEVFNALNTMPKWLQSGIKDVHLRHGRLGYSIETSYILPVVFELKEMK